MPMKFPPHPGKGLKDEFEYLGLSTTLAAEVLGVSRMQLHRVLTEQSAISPEMALRLETVIGSSAEHWLRRQASYEVAKLLRNGDNPAQGLRRISVPSKQPAEQPGSV